MNWEIRWLKNEILEIVMTVGAENSSQFMDYFHIQSGAWFNYFVPVIILANFAILMNIPMAVYMIDMCVMKAKGI